MCNKFKISKIIFCPFLYNYELIKEKLNLKSIVFFYLEIQGRQLNNDLTCDNIILNFSIPIDSCIDEFKSFNIYCSTLCSASGYKNYIKKMIENKNGLILTNNTKFEKEILEMNDYQINQLCIDSTKYYENIQSNFKVNFFDWEK